MDLKNYLVDVFGENSEEVNIILECYRIITSSSPSTASESKNQMYILDNIRSKMSTLLFMTNRLIHHYNETTQGEYDSKYVRLVKLGRPSHAAIESEIRSTDSDYTLSYFRINSLNNVKDLITSYIRCIDECKRTAVEVLKNCMRLD